MPRRVAYLSTEDLEGFFVYDELTYEPLRARGVAVEAIPWRATAVDWDDFEAVVVRSTWDYQASPGRFLQQLERIDRSRARLFNPLALIRWNLDKRYLLELEACGARIVPTVVLESANVDAARAQFERFSTDELVLKPVVGANSDGVRRIRRGDTAALAAALSRAPAMPLLVQPFVPAIVEQGEFSLFYFAGRYSHAILKTPAEGDFRVQEEHGGRLRAIVPEEPLLRAGEAAIAALPQSSLYARIDFVRHADGAFMLMEAELIEPSLYFPYDAQSPARFADALVAALDATDPG